MQQQIDELNRAVEQLQQRLGTDMQHLADRMQEQLPLFAALTAARREQAVVVQSGVVGPPPPVKSMPREFRP